MTANQKVTVYYNDIDISEKPYRIHAGCPSVELPWREATETAEKKIDSEEWSQYLIPTLTGAKVINEGQSDDSGEKVSQIECEACGNKEEVISGPEELDNFFHTGGNNFICSVCYQECKSNTE